MSRIFYCPDVLLPRPTILSSQEVRKPGDRQERRDPGMRANQPAGCSHQSHQASALEQPHSDNFDIGTSRDSMLSSGRQNRSGVSQQYWTHDDSADLGPLYDGAGPREVQTSFILKHKKIKEAEMRSDREESARLRNLDPRCSNIFDNINGLAPMEFESEHRNRNRSGSADASQSDADTDVEDEDTEDQTRYHSVTIRTCSHSRTLCLQMQIQIARGIRVPDEFANCTEQPGLNRPSTPNIPFGSASPDSSRSIVGSVATTWTSPSRTVRTATTAPSTPGSSSPSRGGNEKGTAAHTWNRDTPTSILTSHPSPTTPPQTSTSKPPPTHKIESETEPSDIWLALKPHLPHRPRLKYNLSSPLESNPNPISNPIRLSSSRPPQQQPSNRHPCLCKTHTCIPFLSGPPSRHCRHCRLPRLQPEVRAAKGRVIRWGTIAERGGLGGSVSGERIVPRELRADEKFVTAYEEEMERRCERGVWWEGWMVVEGLRGGAVGL
ncbi:hypothetical protein MMC21_005747 [Puttea exsequens]|nr:hypothetical protein [Puttea exsequens]